MPLHRGPINVMNEQNCLFAAVRAVVGLSHCRWSAVFSASSARIVVSGALRIGFSYLCLNRRSVVSILWIVKHLAEVSLGRLLCLKPVRAVCFSGLRSCDVCANVCFHWLFLCHVTATCSHESWASWNKFSLCLLESTSEQCGRRVAVRWISMWLVWGFSSSVATCLSTSVK